MPAFSDFILPKTGIYTYKKTAANTNPDRRKLFA
jgi:hypothetical protein